MYSEDSHSAILPNALIQMETGMTGNKHNTEGHSGDHGEQDPGPYWHRMHRDWRFWVCAFLMAVALAVFVMSGNLAFIPSR